MHFFWISGFLDFWISSGFGSSTGGTGASSTGFRMSFSCSSAAMRIGPFSSSSDSLLIIIIPVWNRRQLGTSRLKKGYNRLDKKVLITYLTRTGSSSTGTAGSSSTATAGSRPLLLRCSDILGAGFVFRTEYFVRAILKMRLLKIKILVL